MKDPSRLRVSGPLAPYAQGFAAELSRLGYTPYTPVSASFQIQVLAHLSRWLGDAGLEVVGLAPTTVAAFLTARRADGYTNYLSVKALAPLLEAAHERWRVLTGYELVAEVLAGAEFKDGDPVVKTDAEEEVAV